jgi:hypothetical protein
MKSIALAISVEWHLSVNKQSIQDKFYVFFDAGFLCMKKNRIIKELVLKFIKKTGLKITKWNHNYPKKLFISHCMSLFNKNRSF